MRLPKPMVTAKSRLSQAVLALRGTSAEQKQGIRRASRETWESPYVTALRNVVPGDTNLGVYKILRESCPPINAAIGILAGLVGELEVTADEPLKAEIDTFVEGVKVNHLGRGLLEAQSIHIDNMLWSGKAGLEIVPNNAANDIYALTNLESDTLEFRRPDETGRTLELIVCQQQAGYSIPVDLDQNMVCVNTYGNTNNPHGRSMLWGLPFVAEILVKAEQALGQTWERMGAPPFHINWVPPKEFHDPDGTTSTAIMGAAETAWTQAMGAKKEGKVRDFFSSGLEVKVIGADGQVLDFTIPYRSCMEQIVSVTHLPPWMLGFHWSTTERMSKQQADLLGMLIGSIRSSILPSWQYIIDLWMALTGRDGEYTLSWDSVSLQDEVETARAELIEAQAVAKREETAGKLWTSGIFTQEQYAEHTLCDDFDGEIAEKMDKPPAAPAPTLPGQDGKHVTPATFTTSTNRHRNQQSTQHGFLSCLGNGNGNTLISESESAT